jgi:hypothetical protein
MSVTKIESEINAVSDINDNDCILRFRSKSNINHILLQIQVFQKCNVCIKAADTITGMSYALDMQLVLEGGQDNCATSKKDSKSTMSSITTNNKKQKLPLSETSKNSIKISRLK